MPEALIINRFKYKYNVTIEWRKDFNSLNPEQRKLAEEVIAKNDFSDEIVSQFDGIMQKVLKYYQIRKDQ